MKILPLIVSTTVALAVGFAFAGAEPPSTLSRSVFKDPALTIEAHGNGRDQLTIALKNTSATPITVTIPAGLIAAGSTSESRMIVVRAATATIPAQSAMDVSLPVVALTSKSVAKSERFELQDSGEPRLAALLKTLADQPDAPRGTVQLAVLCVLEDLTFAQWRQFLSPPGETAPTPAEVTQAIDTLGLLRVASPEGHFALASDPELKLRALRNPWSRAKAVALYGLDSGDGAVAPDLRQLLHTQPGDNCPICRQRALMQKQAEIP